MAGRGLGSLTLDLILKLGAFTPALNKAERELDRSTKRMNKMAYEFGRSIGNAAKSFLAFAGVGLSLRAVTTQLKGAIDAADDMAKASKRVGESTEAFSRLTYAGGLADVSMDTLVSTLGKLTKAQAMALDSSTDQAKVFNALGISVKDTEGKLRSGIDVMLDFADKFKEAGRSQEAIAAGLMLFGRSFQDVIPLIQDGSGAMRELFTESDKVGATLDGPTGAAAEKFNDTLHTMSVQIDGAWKRLAAKLLPQLQALADWAGAAGDESSGLAKAIAFVGNEASAAVKDMQFFVASVKDLNTWVTSTTEGIGQMAGAFGNVLAGNFAKAAAQFKLAQGNADAAYNAAFTGSKAKDPFKVVFAGEGKDPSGLFRNPAAEPKTNSALNERIQAALGKDTKTGGSKKAGKSDAEKEAERLLQAYERLKSSLTEQVALFGKVGETVKDRYDLEFGELAKLDPLKKAELTTILDKIDALNDEKDAQEALDKITKEREDAINRGVEAADAMIESRRFELSLLGMTNIQMEREIALRQAGKFATDEQKAAILDLTDALVIGQKEAQRLADTQSTLADSLYSAASGAESALDAVKSFFDGIAKNLLRAASESWAEKITDLFRGSGTSGGGGSSSGGFWSSLAGMFFGGHASGGAMQGGSISRVNEYGPEMFTSGGKDYLMTGSRGGFITPTQRVGADAGGGDVHVHMPRNTSYETAQQAGQAAMAGASRAARRNGA